MFGRGPAFDGWLAASTMEDLAVRAERVLADRRYRVVVDGPKGREVDEDLELRSVRWGEIRPFGSDGFEIVSIREGVPRADRSSVRRLTWHVDFRTEEAAAGYDGPSEFNRAVVRVRFDKHRICIDGPMAERPFGAYSVTIEVSPVEPTNVSWLPAVFRRVRGR